MDETKCLSCETAIDVTGRKVDDVVQCDNCKREFTICEIGDWGFGLEFHLFEVRESAWED